MVKIKICGIRSLKEALWAVDAGADAVGFVMAESRRRVTPRQVEIICRGIPPFVSKIGVFVDENPGIMKEIADRCGLDVLQFHGQEPPSHLQGFKQKVIKAFSLKDEMSLQEVEPYRLLADAFLLDTCLPGMPGGTGISFDWSLAEKLTGRKSVILAGGLNAENIVEALEQVKPYGVDVSSGVETHGHEGKDPVKIKEFIQRVRSWEYVSG
ncbi:phosphoribosylanthranilate isomerase [Candidatus Contubernalis alkaliaceticus]|uniref:phosphoribosylanthranilate isomerase n=1 Tax=Candidatus Contubernalis alkaliaceticus TaxID=338645 RepID=UPI001F4BD548|nr:phosphoribosylanthranilate isomerase [Candidatus Contubernalis alkalaceticus]UNC92606.1 phosphoribosylanthranilate isomerase [Candidatus Contubernalis alkalaceticus]